MSHDEIIDIFDEERQHIGTSTKREAHTKGLWHTVGHCWVYHPDRQTVIFQLRGGKRKNDFKLLSDMLDISAAGHVGAGEEPRSGMLREIEEELGLTPDPNKLQYLGCKPDIFILKDFRDFGFCEVYLYPFNGQLEDLTLQEEELDGIFELPLNKAKDLFAGRIEEIRGEGVTRFDDSRVQRTFTKSDFVPKPLDFYLLIMIMIERAINGEEDIVIA